MSDVIARKNLWLRSTIWDGFWMLSGIWLLIPLLTFSHTSKAIPIMLIIATLILWLSHRFATTYNAFCTPAYRALRQGDRTRFVIWPIAAISATFVFVFAPRVLVPLDA